jgi:hypothetical protein
MTARGIRSLTSREKLSPDCIERMLDAGDKHMHRNRTKMVRMYKGNVMINLPSTLVWHGRGSEVSIQAGELGDTFSIHVPADNFRDADKEMRGNQYIVINIGQNDLQRFIYPDELTFLDFDGIIIPRQQDVIKVYIASLFR